MIRQRKPIKRTALKKKVTKRRKAVKALTDSALDLYFSLGLPSLIPVLCVEDVDPSLSPGVCQICGWLIYRHEADPCHLFRRFHGLHEPQHLIAGHRMCHTWMDAKKEREDFARESGVSCLTGGVIQWPPHMRASLDEWLTKGVDRINLRRK